MVFSVFISAALPILKHYLQPDAAPNTFVPAENYFDQKARVFEAEWQRELTADKPSLLKALWRTCRWQYCGGVVFVVFNYLSVLCQGVILGLIIDMISESTTLELGLSATGLIILGTGTLILYNYGVYRLSMLSSSFRPWIGKLLAQKAAGFAVDDGNAAKLLNVAVNELSNFDFLGSSANVWAIPIVLPLGAWSLVMYLGLSGLLSILLLLVHLLLILGLASFNMRYRAAATEHGDERVALILNILEGIRAVKLFAWEDLCLHQVQETRKLESREYAKMGKAMAIAKALNVGLIGSTIAVPLLILTAEGESIQLSEVLASIVILYVLNVLLTYDCVIGLSLLFFIVTGCSRLTEVLLLKESPKQRPQQASPGVMCSDLVFARGDSYRLSIDFQARPGELIAVTGPIGSGKTTLLLGLLGELPILKGTFSRQNSLSYCSNPPFIFKASLQENITMGSSFFSKRYARALKYSQLVDDLHQMNQNDCTVLSGGQKMRVGLARAFYADEEVILLDDPFSCLDTQVGRQILGVLGKLTSKGKTVIVTASKRAVLQASNHVVVLKDGNQIHFSSYEALTDVQELKKLPKGPEQMVQTASEDAQPKFTDHQVSRPFVTLWRQLKLGFGNCLTIGCLVLFLFLFQFMLMLTYFFALMWAEEDDQWLLVWVMLGHSLFLYLSGIARYSLLYCGLIKSNSALSAQALSGLLRSAYSILTSMPIPGILEPFTTDVKTLDETFFHFFIECTTLGMILLGNALVLIVLAPFTLVSIAITVLCYIFVFRYVNPVTKKVRGIDIVMRGGVLGQMTCLIQGGPTIRVSKSGPAFIEKAVNIFTDTMKSTQTYYTVLRFYQLLVDVSCSSLVLFTLISILAFSDLDNPLYIALCFVISISTALVADSSAIAFQHAEAFTASPERLLEFADLPPEPEQHSTLSLTNGQIKFVNLSLKYPHSNNPALNNIDLCVQPGQHIGIVGRSGSGKTSLLLTLFRLVEPTQGTVFLDGQDYQYFNLTSLRTQLAAVPQHPFIFRGTVRQNLDPYHKCTDHQCTAILQRVGLSFDVTESVVDLNLTSGERQLLSVAKALLQRTKVIVFDEATSYLDIDSELSIMRVLSEELEGCTALIIAHRLVAVVEADLIVVLKDGEVVEEGVPKVLARGDTYFSELIKASGPQESELLRSILSED